MMREGFAVVFWAIFGKPSFLVKKNEKNLVTPRLLNKDTLARSFEQRRRDYFVSVNYVKNRNYAYFKAKVLTFLAMCAIMEGWGFDNAET